MSDGDHTGSVPAPEGEKPPEKKTQTVTLSNLTKKKAPVALVEPDLSGAPYHEQIARRRAAEAEYYAPSQVPAAPKPPGKGVEEMDRTIYLNLPKSYGYAIRNYAVQNKEKVNQTILRAIQEFMERNNVKPIT